MIDSYVRRKTELYSEFSAFSCGNSCPRYGCCGDLLVTASLLEIYKQSRFLGITAAELFKRAFKINPSLDNGFEWARIRFTLTKPCTFLENDRLCAVYPVRPAVCALFPEYLALWDKEEQEGYIERSRIGHFPCVKNMPLAVSEARKGVLCHLWRLHTQEILATEIYLFGIADFSVDLREDILMLCDDIEREIPYPKSEEALQATLSGKDLKDRIAARMMELETAEGLQGYISALTIAEAVVEQDGTPLIFPT